MRGATNIPLLAALTLATAPTRERQAVPPKTTGATSGSGLPEPPRRLRPEIRREARAAKNAERLARRNRLVAKAEEKRQRKAAARIYSSFGSVVAPARVGGSET